MYLCPICQSFVTYSNARIWRFCAVGSYWGQALLISKNPRLASLKFLARITARLDPNETNL